MTMCIEVPRVREGLWVGGAYRLSLSLWSEWFAVCRTGLRLSVPEKFLARGVAFDEYRISLTPLSTVQTRSRLATSESPSLRL